MPFLASVGGAMGYGRPVRSQAAATSPVVTSGLLIHLDAGDAGSYPGSGATWTDLTGNGRNATIVNGSTYSSSNGGYISFLDTSFQHATIPNIGNQATFTLEAWVRITGSLSSRATAIIAGQYDLSTKLNYSLGLNNAYGSANVCIGYFNGAWRTTSGFAPTLNTWYHIVGTYDGTTLRQYENSLAGTTLSYSGTPQSGGEIRIMRRWDEVATNNTNFVKGDLAIVRVYNRALTASEVLQNYNAQKSRYGL